MDKKKVNEIINKLSKAEHDYYVLNKPTMSDAEYDKLYKELKSIEESNPELILTYSPTQRVTGTPSNAFQQVEHRQRMYSLDNSENINDIEDINKDTYSNVELFFSHRRSTHLQNLPTGRMINIIGFSK